MSITHATPATYPDDGTPGLTSADYNAPHVIPDGTITAQMLAAGVVPSVIEHLDPLTTTPEALINALIAHGYMEA